jgi:hypothetical protein
LLLGLPQKEVTVEAVSCTGELGAPEWHPANPDYTVEKHLAEGDMVVTRWTAHATHQGELIGVPPFWQTHCGEWDEHGLHL